MACAFKASSLSQRLGETARRFGASFNQAAVQLKPLLQMMLPWQLDINTKSSTLAKEATATEPDGNVGSKCSVTQAGSSEKKKNGAVTCTR